MKHIVHKFMALFFAVLTLSGLVVSAEDTILPAEATGPKDVTVRQTILLEDKQTETTKATLEADTKFFYKLEIANNGSSALDTFELFDVLPQRSDWHILKEPGAYQAPYRGSRFYVRMSNFVEDIPENAPLLEFFDVFYLDTFFTYDLDTLKNDNWKQRTYFEGVGRKPAELSMVKLKLKEGKKLPKETKIQLYIPVKTPEEIESYDSAQQGGAANNSAAWSYDGQNYTETPVASVSVPLYTITGRFFKDENQDGIKQYHELGTEGRTVELLDGDGKPVLDSRGKPMQTLTGYDGFYDFLVTKSGNYRVRFTRGHRETFVTDPVDHAEGNRIQEIKERQGMTGVYSLSLERSQITLNGAISPAVNMDDVEGSLTLTTVDADDATIKLPDVTYILEQNGFEEYREESDENGVVSFKNIPEGEYTLKVRRVPDRYQDFDETRTIVIDDDHVDVDLGNIGIEHRKVKIITKYFDQYRTEIKPEDVQEGIRVGADYSTQAEEELLHDGHIYRLDKDRLPQNIKGTVESNWSVQVEYYYTRVDNQVRYRYVDEEGNDIQEPETETINAGIGEVYENYPSSQIVDDKWLEWELDEDNLPDNHVMTVTRETPTIVYRYKPRTAAVTVRYYDLMTKKDLQEPTVYHLQIGSEYNVSHLAKPEITIGGVTHTFVGWQEESNNESGWVRFYNGEIVYQYSRQPGKGSVLLHFIDGSTRLPIREPMLVVDKQDVGTPFETNSLVPEKITFNDVNYEHYRLEDDLENIEEGLDDIAGWERYYYLSHFGRLREGLVELTHVYYKEWKPEEPDPDPDPGNGGNVRDDVADNPYAGLGTVYLHMLDQDTGVPLQDAIRAVNWSELGTQYDIRGQAPAEVETEAGTYQLVGHQSGPEFGVLEQQVTDVFYNYKLVGQPDPMANKYGSVRVHLVNEETNQPLIPPYFAIYRDLVGNGYDVSNQPPQRLVIDGKAYLLNGLKSGVESGEIIEAVRDVVYGYRPEGSDTPTPPTTNGTEGSVDDSGTVILHYLDRDTGEELEEPRTVIERQTVGMDYDVSQIPPQLLTTKAGKNYRLVGHKSGQESGQLPKGTTHVYYDYQVVEHLVPDNPPTIPALPEGKIGSVKLQFVNKENNEELQPAFTAVDKVRVGSTYDVTGQAPATILSGDKQYRLVGLKSGAEIGQVAEGDTFVVYQYELVEHKIPDNPPTVPALPELKLGSVKLQFVNQATGEELQPLFTAVNQVEVGSAYDVTGQAPATILSGDKQYRLVGLQSGAEIGQVAEGDTILVYGYELVEAQVPIDPPTEPVLPELKVGSVLLQLVDNTTDKALVTPLVAVQHAEVGSAYDVTGQAPATLRVDGKNYKLVGHKSGAEIGQVAEGETVVVYGYEEVKGPEVPTPQPDPKDPTPQPDPKKPEDPKPTPNPDPKKPEEPGNPTPDPKGPTPQPDPQDPSEPTPTPNPEPTPVPPTSPDEQVELPKTGQKTSDLLVLLGLALLGSVILFSRKRRA